MFPLHTRYAGTAMAILMMPAKGNILLPGRIKDIIRVTGTVQITASQISLAPPRNGQSNPTYISLSANLLCINSETALEMGSKACMKYFEITGNKVRAVAHCTPRVNIPAKLYLAKAPKIIPKRKPKI